MHRRTWLLAATIALIPQLSMAKLNPADIASQVTATGAEATVAKLAARHRWDRTLNMIGTGRPEWLNVARALAPGTDASRSLGLTVALADALPRNPSGVLGVIATGTGPLLLARVCAPPYIEPKPADLASYRAVARKALKTVNDRSLLPARRSCLAALHA